jgi:hypothetical protein
MPRIIAAFLSGGPLMFVIGIIGFTFIPLLVVQFVRYRTLDIIWLLWSLQLVFLSLGLFGLGLGVIEAGEAAAWASDKNLGQAIAPGLSMSLNTFSYGLICPIASLIPLGIATTKVLDRR